MSTGWRQHAVAAKGFMPPDEGDALYEAALAAATAVPGAPFVEIGSYCGRLTIWLAAAAREVGTVVFAGTWTEFDDRADLVDRYLAL